MPGVRTNLDTSLDTFGGGRTFDKAIEASNGLAEEVSKIATIEKKKADDAWAVTARNGILALHDNIQYNAETGFMSKRGRDVRGLPQQVESQWNKGYEELSKMANNDEQRYMLSKMASEQYHEVNRDLQKHVYVETARADKDAVEANMLTLRSMAPNAVRPDGSVDDDKILEYTNEQKFNLDNLAARYPGTPKEVLEAQKTEQVSKLHSSVIGRILAQGNGTAAKKYFDQYKGEINGDDQTTLIDRMDNELALDRGVALFAYAKDKFMRADGTIDESRMEAHIMADKDLSTKEKLDAFKVANARSSEYYQNKRRDDSARDLQVMNGLIGIREKKDGTLEEAFRYVNSIPNQDNYTRRSNLEVATKLFRGEKVDNPVEHMKLWEKVQDGTAGKADIYAAYAGPNPTINSAQYESLMKESYRQQNGGIDPQEKTAWQFIKSDIKSSTADKTEAAQFLRTIQTLSEGKSSQEILKLYEDEKKKIPSGHWYTADPLQWKSDYERINKHDLYWGEVKTSLGEDTTRAIGEAIQFGSKKSQYDPQDMESYANVFGGMKNIRPGTPTYNAIRSIMKEKDRNGNPVLVTPANVKAWLAVHPDGIVK